MEQSLEQATAAPSPTLKPVPCLRRGARGVFGRHMVVVRHAERETYGLLSSKDGVIPGGRVHNGDKLLLAEDVPLQSAAE